MRTVYRDVETLSMAGGPVCTETDRGGGVSLTEGCRFDKALLSDAEQNQLLFAVPLPEKTAAAGWQMRLAICKMVW